MSYNIDLSGAVGKLIASLLFGLAEIELNNIKERQLAGIALAKEKGLYKGRQKGSYKASPERVASLFDRGYKVAEISRCMGVGTTTVYEYLHLRAQL